MLHQNYENALKNIRTAMEKSGRTDSVEIIAASKTRPIAELQQAYDLGIKVFGENRVQELTDKYTPKFLWDMIGQLQTNKVKYLVGKVRLIQSVDRISLAETIHKVASSRGVTQDVLIEINGGDEPDKGGVSPTDALRFFKEVSTFSALNVKGIMTVMPIADEVTLRKLYQNIADVRNDILQFDPTATAFSGGMSNDYALAVEYGSSMVRLGRALFGARDTGIAEKNTK